MKIYSTAKPLEVITDYELIISLERYNFVKRQAILFAISSQIPADDIQNLNWTTVHNYPLSKKSIDILNRLPRHLFSSLVFWEEHDGRIMKIKNLKEDCEEVAGSHSWAEFVELNKNVVDIAKSAADFIRILARQAFLESCNGVI